MKDPKDPGTANLFMTKNAARQARFAEKMRQQGKRQRKFLITDDEYQLLKSTLESHRAQNQGG